MRDRGSGGTAKWRDDACTLRTLAAAFGILLVATLVVPAEAASVPTALVSRTTDGTKANGQSVSASVSEHGRFVAFRSAAPNLPGGDGTASLVYRHGPR